MRYLALLLFAACAAQPLPPVAAPCPACPVCEVDDTNFDEQQFSTEAVAPGPYVVECTLGCANITKLHCEGWPTGQSCVIGCIAAVKAIGNTKHTLCTRDAKTCKALDTCTF